jgi:hypothetical protein
MIDYNNFVHNYQEIIILKAKMTRNEQKRMIKSRLLSVFELKIISIYQFGDTIDGLKSD